MRSFPITLGLLALVTWTTTAMASSAFQPALGDVYLSFNPIGSPPVQGEDRYRSIPTLSLFEFHVVVRVDFTAAGDPGRNQTSGLAGWEAAVRIPPEISVVARTLHPLGSTAPFTIEDNWVATTGTTCVQSSNQPYAVVTYTCILLAPASDLHVSLGAATPSTFELPAPGSPMRAVPGWLECPPDSGRLYPFANGWVDGWIEINPSTCVPPDCPIPTEQESWGAVKSRFSAN